MYRDNAIIIRTSEDLYRGTHYWIRLIKDERYYYAIERYNKYLLVTSVELYKISKKSFSNYRIDKQNPIAILPKEYTDFRKLKEYLLNISKEEY